MRSTLLKIFKKSYSYKTLLILIATVKGFIKNEGFDKAATLTFYALLSIIPLIAIGFGIAEVLGFEESFIKELKSHLTQQPEVANKIVQFAQATLRQTRGGIIAAFGLVVLLWTVLKMLGNIATTLNHIWRVKKARSWGRRVLVFLPLILLFPAFLVGASSFIVYISAKALVITTHGYLAHVAPFVLYLLELILFIFISAFLSFIYIYFPNTKVDFKVGIMAGSITTVLYLIWQWIYITFQLNAASWGAIYGGFAAIPLFLIWLNYSWLIVLFGSQLAFQIQKTQKASRR